MTQQQGISESKIDQTAQFERLLATSTISASRLVKAASIIGRTLQGIPKAQRKLTVARMRNLAQEFKRASGGNRTSRAKSGGFPAKPFFIRLSR
ncbi:hypothetical protein R1479_04541 [Ralstonia mannitolilytica]|uniref:hypothetical protein n=1 Tax=Ralstonia mannitolilytica TaxID=105219 RepID=UPI0028F59793|nr:hypothetical protein [Ralstonia mannitolilytica]CAJ0900808.1 hypothetical protein R1479_04541 [Ralstonia mannitolilytica]